MLHSSQRRADDGIALASEHLQTRGRRLAGARRRDSACNDQCCAAGARRPAARAQRRRRCDPRLPRARHSS